MNIATHYISYSAQHEKYIVLYLNLFVLHPTLFSARMFYGSIKTRVPNILT